ncbi:MAG: SNF2-related protein [Kiritimatiellia bacterium]
MSLYLAHHHVRAWADAKTLQQAQNLLEQAAVQQLSIEGTQVRAAVRAAGHQTYTRFSVLPDGSVLSDCPCPQSQLSGIVCAHVVAAGLAIAARTEDTRKERSLRIDARKAHEADRLAHTHPPDPLSGRSCSSDPAAINAHVRLRLPADWRQELDQHHLLLQCRIEIDGKRTHPDRIKPGRDIVFSPADLNLLYVLEDIAHTDICPSVIRCDKAQFGDLLFALAGKQLSVLDQPEPLLVSDTSALSALQLHLTQNSAPNLTLQHTSLPEGTVFLACPRTAWILHENTCYPLDPVLPEEWADTYNGALQIPPHRILSFIRHTLPTLKEAFPVEDETGLPSDVEVCEGTPSFAVRIKGGLETMQITFLAKYAGTYFPVSSLRPSPDDAVPDPQHPTRFIGRNHGAEQSARGTFIEMFGMQQEGTATCRITGQQAMLEIITHALPKARARSWIIHTQSAFAVSCEEGSWIETELHILPDASDAYRIEMRYRDETGKPISTEAVEAALSLGQTMLVEHGRSLIMDAHSLRSLQAALAECTEFRATVPCVSRIHAGFIASLVEHYPRLHISAPPDWMHHAQQLHLRQHLPETQFPARLDNTLRGYQKDGIRWLRFLEQFGYAGILADEMGLGKTVQALAWLQQRKNMSTEKRTSIVICPTSLLVNWGREIDRFVPELSYCIISGSQRHNFWNFLQEYDIVITSYALLRRDSDRYTRMNFSAVVLDEAQHIKNRSTQNALAAKRLRADCRLVLTGTPIENSVTDLWSIMDFLMPGYLGSHNSFRIRFEQPVQHATANSDKALEHLRCKLSPFMLRRLKSEVAAEMPPKVTRIASAPMYGAQQRLYQRLLASYYEQISSLVDSQGFDRSRFSVFSALLRLRQCCCHPALLRQIKGTDEMTSAKMDLFFELLDEAIDGGHRVLVFSQFVQMLHILRTALIARNIRYCYLDGATRNRMEQVDTFNNTPDIPVFLVSLKAGGSGLNLTGANVVIHYDPWWNPAVEDQATDRTHRIGQTQTVYSIKLVTENSIEQKVIDLQHRKRQIINAAMGASGGFAQQLTWDDIRELLQP